MKKIEKICVLNFIFRVIAACGIIGFIAIALLSDGDSINLAKTFTFGSIGFSCAALGIWGSINCQRMIESYRRAFIRRSTSLRSYDTAAKAA